MSAAETKCLGSSRRFGWVSQKYCHRDRRCLTPCLKLFQLGERRLNAAARWPIQDTKDQVDFPNFTQLSTTISDRSLTGAPARNQLEAALRNVKGRNRRETIRDYHSNGFLLALSDNLLRDTLEEDRRESLGLIHSSFMGGEHLPDYSRHEVEIARIELQSTTSDVISIRARPRGKRIEYSVCDEYQVESRLPQKLRADLSRSGN